MKYMILPDGTTAELAQSVILKLGARALSFEGYLHNDNLEIVGGKKNGEFVTGVVSERWSDVLACAEGFSIIHPDNFRLDSGESLMLVQRMDYPASLAVGFGLDPSSIDWTSLGILDPFAH